MASMKWSNKSTLIFLSMYEKESVIWNPKHSNYKNRNANLDAWVRIQKALCAQSIQCTVVDLKKKKESLMAVFRPILQKVKNGHKLENGTTELYKPTWFAFSTMARFLKDVYQPKEEMDNSIEPDETELSADEIEDTIQNKYQPIEDNCYTPSTTSIEQNDLNIFKPPEPEHKPSEPKSKKTKRKAITPIDEWEERRDCTYETTMAKNVCESPERDECSMFAELLARKLRKFDESTRDILMHEIDNLIFQTRFQKVKADDSDYFVPQPGTYYEEIGRNDPLAMHSPDSDLSQQSQSPSTWKHL